MPTREAKKRFTNTSTKRKNYDISCRFERSPRSQSKSATFSDGFRCSFLVGRWGSFLDGLSSTSTRAIGLLAGSGRLAGPWPAGVG